MLWPPPSPRHGVNDVDLQALRAGQPAGAHHVSLQGLQPARRQTMTVTELKATVALRIWTPLRPQVVGCIGSPAKHAAICG